MAKASAAKKLNVELWRKAFEQNEEPGISTQGAVKFTYGRYGINNLEGDDTIVYLPGGSVRGPWKSYSDVQSDYTVTTPTQQALKRYATVLDQFQQYKNNFFTHNWATSESSDVEEPSENIEVIEPVDEQETDAIADDISQWPPDQLATAIMDAEAETDMPRLREMILFAEDTDFSVEQSERLSPWLLSFAQRYRDSSAPQNKVAVWSAIRTGASMLRPEVADRLHCLLEPKHSIDTSLVTVKMLGRIFEAQPPIEVDGHQDLAKEVFQIAKASLNPYVFDPSQTAAKAQLAIYALAAIASSELLETVKDVQRLDINWFTQRALRKLRELRNKWTSSSTNINEAPLQLLDKALRMLG